MVFHICPAGSSHPFPLIRRQVHQADNCVGNGGNIFRLHAETAAGFEDGIISRGCGVNDRFAGRHVIHQLVRADAKPVQRMFFPADEQAIDALQQLVLDTASGKPARNEINDEREIALWKTGVTL